MTTLTVTAKGRVTLRKDVLEHVGVHPGEKVSVDKLPGGRIGVRALRPGRQISGIFNLLQRKDCPPLSIEEIGQASARGWAGKR